MKIVLVSPPNEYLNRLPPLGTAYLAGYVRTKGYSDISIIDCDIMHYSIEQAVQAVLLPDPDVVGFSVLSSSYLSAIEIAREIKRRKPGVAMIFGGPHPTALPDDVMKNGFVDVVCVGEGEETFHELLDAFSRNAGLADVKGILYRTTDGQVKRTARRDYIMDLDSIPYPARDLLPQEKYDTPGSSMPPGRFKYTYIMTSRGCPYQCVYCSSHVALGRKVRFRSIPNIIGEIEELATRYGIHYFRIMDDVFTIDKARVMELCGEIIRRKLNVVWDCMSRINLVDEQTLRAMKDSGCYMIMYGFESGSQDILNNIKKGTTLENALKITELTRKVGIKVCGNFMIGNPGETDASVEASIDFARKLRLDSVGVSITTPYPGTELFDLHREELGDRIDWNGFVSVSINPDTERRPFISCCDWNTEELYQRYIYASRKINLQPHYVMQRFFQIRSMKEFFLLFRRVISILRDSVTKKRTFKRSQASAKQ